jgi:hypothetical protein
MTYPTNHSEVPAIVGKVIRFNRNVEETEIDFDESMKARVVSYRIVDYDVFQLTLDFSEFEEDNKRLMKHNYYDSNGKPTLRWCDTRYYPKYDCIANAYFGFWGEGSNCFYVCE